MAFFTYPVTWISMKRSAQPLSVINTDLCIFQCMHPYLYFTAWIASLLIVTVDQLKNQQMHLALRFQSIWYYIKSGVGLLRSCNLPPFMRGGVEFTEFSPKKRVQILPIKIGFCEITEKLVKYESFSKKRQVSLIFILANPC